MKYQLWYSNRFKRQYKKLKQSGDTRVLRELKEALSLLVLGQSLPPKYCNHKLIGKLVGYYECHIAPNWLLVYSINKDILVVELVAMGSHANLFK